MKLILLILVFLPFTLSLPTHECNNCEIYKLHGALYLKDNNITDWNGDKTIIDLPSRMSNITILTYEPTSVWMDDNGKIIGMSDRDSFVIIYKNDINVTNSDLSHYMNGLLKKDDNWSMRLTEEEKKEIKPLSKEETEAMIKDVLSNRLISDRGGQLYMREPNWLQYVQENLFNHENVLDWVMKKFFDEDNIEWIAPRGYQKTREYYEAVMKTFYTPACQLGPSEQINYLHNCDGELIEVNLFDDLSDNEWKGCNHISETFYPDTNETWRTWRYAIELEYAQKHGMEEEYNHGATIDEFGDDTFAVWEYGCKHNKNH